MSISYEFSPKLNVGNISRRAFGVGQYSCTAIGELNLGTAAYMFVWLCICRPIVFNRAKREQAERRKFLGSELKTEVRPLIGLIPLGLSEEQYVEQSREELSDAVKSFTHWLSGSASHRAFFAAHEARHLALKEFSDDAVWQSLTSADDLQRYYERLLDAHTIEDALTWHAAICGILLEELEALDALREIPHYHVYMRALIETRIEHHADLMLHLSSLHVRNT
jgi:hypothetical protein